MTEANRFEFDWDKQLEGIDFSLPLDGNKLLKEGVQSPSFSSYQWKLIPERWRKMWQADIEQRGQDYLVEDMLECRIPNPDFKILNILFNHCLERLFHETALFKAGSAHKKLAVTVCSVNNIRSDDGLETYGLLVAARHQSVRINSYNQAIGMIIQKVNNDLRYIDRPLIPPFDPKF